MATAGYGVAFGDASPFWLTYGAGEFKVGINGSEVPFMEYKDSDVTSSVVKRVSLHTEDADIAQWKVHAPCTPQR